MKLFLFNDIETFYKSLISNNIAPKDNFRFFQGHKCFYSGLIVTS